MTGRLLSLSCQRITREWKKRNVFEKSICILREGKRFQCDYRYFVPCQLSASKLKELKTDS